MALLCQRADIALSTDARRREKRSFKNGSVPNLKFGNENRKSCIRRAAEMLHASGVRSPELIREIRAIRGSFPIGYGKTERARPHPLTQSASRPARKIESSRQTATTSADPD
jgi:hypothetical protein